MGRYSDMHCQSLESREEFWRERAALIHWQTPFSKVLDYSRPPFAKWFVGGTTNLCYNAVDRHLAERADQPALKFVSTETGDARVFTYRDLYVEVNRFAAILKSLGVDKGDRVLIYMPMIPEAVFAMLACARIGAIHSVVFGGFAAASLATRIDDAAPKVMITADAGMRGGKAIPYKHLVDEAIRVAKKPPANVITVDRGLVNNAGREPGAAARESSTAARESRIAAGESSIAAGESSIAAGESSSAGLESGTSASTSKPTTARDLDYAQLTAQHNGATVDCEWLESSEPSYILYTSGTTGKPKGVQRDTGGYAVALAWSMPSIFCVDAGDNFFCTSDIGWVVGHSYIVYGPLIAGATTIMYEGLPIRPDPGIWWKIVADNGVKSMFTSPTAIRVLKKQDSSFMRMHDTSCLRRLFLAGEPLDEPTARWVSDALGASSPGAASSAASSAVSSAASASVAIIDNYWQTETGWPILSAQPGVEDTPRKFGSPSFPVMGYDVRLVDETTGKASGTNEKGVLTIAPPLPPGCMSTIWGDDDRFVSTYFETIPGQLLYSTFDWATRDAEGYYFVLGRTDDVINVAGHRLGTREIEEAVQTHSGIAEVAVVGVADLIKGQVPVAFVVVRDASKTATPEMRATFEREVMAAVDRELGAVGRPARVHFVTLLPKTRSGKLLRRSIQALAEGRPAGDLTTIEDPNALEQIRVALQGS